MGGRSVEDVEVLSVVLNDPQLRWLTARAAEQEPALSAGTMLGRLVDEAMVEQREESRRREERLEVYRASGYPEHHPDYPDLPRGLSDV